ncbi:hypothetical protein HYS28_02070 [Candidatus Uhrbacteria bacterium]|nr:hypothetical protein [Candidatus Uhrbacteria bacterium]
MKDIFDEIVGVSNLFVAWQEFRRGKRDRMDVMEFERHLEDNVFSLHEELAGGIYRHGPYHRFHVFDPKHRIIHKATVRDRLVHHAVYRVLLPIFERSFIFDSYSCREGKGTHAAVRRLEVFARKVSKNFTGPCWALKFDIKKFFDSVDHGILLGILERQLSKDPSTSLGMTRVMQLLQEIVGSYHNPFADRGGVASRSPDREPDQPIICQRLHGCIRPLRQRGFATTILHSLHR